MNYNKLLNKKPVFAQGSEGHSYDILNGGKNYTGGTYTVVDTVDAAGNWCKKQ